jgi:hypothetical protein
MDAAGTVGALDAPGLGVTLDDDAIASAVLASFSVDASG